MQINILLIALSPGDDNKGNIAALVPADKLEGIDLGSINGWDCHDPDCSDEIGGEIAMLFIRLGIEPADDVGADLESYTRVPLPWIVDKVIVISWSV